MKKFDVALAMWALLSATGCSLALNPEFDDGQLIDETKFGANCRVDDECGGYLCRANRCTSSCETTTDCHNPAISDCSASSKLCTFRFPAPIEDPKVGFLYVGPVGDHGWTLTHEVSRQHIQAEISGLTTQFEPTVNPANAAEVMQNFIDAGDNIIIGTSFDFLVPIQTMAANNPDVNFLLCSGFTSTPNLGSYFGRMYQVMYMMGIIAGRETTTNRVGIVGPVVIPETVRHANAFAQGVKSVNPSARVYIDWVGAWFAPEAEAAATNRLIDEATVDIVFGFTDTIVPIRTACGPETGPCTRTTTTGATVYSLGYDNRDSCDFAPDRCLASAYWNWGPRLERIVNDMKAGTWDPSLLVWDQIRGSPDASMAYIAVNETLVPPAVQIEAESQISKMTPDTVEARMLPFAGGMRDSRGNERYTADELPTDSELLRMCWLADNVFAVDGSGATAPGCVGDN